jgi:hypothetical protein
MLETADVVVESICFSNHKQEINLRGKKAAGR